MKTSVLKRSLLDYAIKGKLSARFRRENPNLSATDEINAYNEQITQSRKTKQKELGNLEKALKEKGADKQTIKPQITALKKEIAKLKEIVILNSGELPFTIPNSWAWVRLGNIVEIINGTSYAKTDLTSPKDGIRILRGGNINENTYKIDYFSDDIFITKNLFDSQKNIKQFDIVIVASTGSEKVIGKPAFIEKALENTQIGAFLRIIRCIDVKFASYVSFIFMSDFYRNNLRKLVRGTSIGNVKNEYIKNFLIPLPPLAEQMTIANILDTLMLLVDKYESTLEDLRNLKG